MAEVKIRFKIFPKSEDIKWAANADVYSGSVWDASEKVNKDKKSEIIGVSYTKTPALRSVDSVQPNLADIIDKLAHHHNELGIELIGNNFRLEYDENVPYSTKKILDTINNILDQKYGKLVEPKIFNDKNKIKYILYDSKDSISNKKESIGEFNTKQEATNWIIKYFDSNFIRYEIEKVLRSKGKQPTQTKENLKKSIESVKDKILKEAKPLEFILNNDKYTMTIKYSKIELFKNGETISLAEYEKAQKASSKEYTSQAEINAKVAALKEGQRKYPRSLIRSEVKSIDLNYEEDILFQKVKNKQKKDKVLFAKDLVEEDSVDYMLKVVNVLSKLKRNKFSKQKQQGWINDLQKQGVTNQQIELFKESAKEDMTRDEIILDLVSKYNFAVESNVAKTTNEFQSFSFNEETNQPVSQLVTEINISQTEFDEALNQAKDLNISIDNRDRDGMYFTLNNIEYHTVDAEYFKKVTKKESSIPSQHYKNLTIKELKDNPDYEYREIEIRTPAITPSIKGHAQFSTDEGIGWVRLFYNKKTGEVVIQELQSDLFQKGRDKENLISKTKQVDYYEGSFFTLENRRYESDKFTNEYWYTENRKSVFINKHEFEKAKQKALDTKIPIKDKESNQFLQLLNKDGNWIKFFIKTIVQDSIKKGYKKVLFPTGETAAKVEGHDTIANDLLRIDKELSKLKTESYYNLSKLEKEKNEGDVKRLEDKKQELKTQGIEKLKPIEGFYENRVQNVLKKQFGKNNVRRIKDEFGNEWFEVDLANEQVQRKVYPILLSKDKTMEIKLEDISFNKTNSIQDFAKENKLDTQQSPFAKRKDTSYNFVYKEADDRGVSVSKGFTDISKLDIPKDVDTKGIRAGFDTKSNKIKLTKEFEKLSSYDRSRILAHESLHGIITHKLSTLSESELSALNSKLDAFIEDLKTNEDLKDNPEVKRVLSNIEEGNSQELITYAFTDPKFAAALNSITIEGEPSENKTFWQRLKEIISSILSDDRTKLDELTDILDAHLDINDAAKEQSDEIKVQERVGKVINSIKTNRKGEILAPNGKVSKLYKDIEILPEIKSKEQAEQLYLQTQSKEFKKWFGNSKVVDENGEPLMVYHGTSPDKSFSSFSKDKFKTGEGFMKWGAGFYFTEQKTTAKSYAHLKFEGEEIDEGSLGFQGEEDSVFKSLLEKAPKIEGDPIAIGLKIEEKFVDFGTTEVLVIRNKDYILNKKGVLEDIQYLKEYNNKKYKSIQNAYADIAKASPELLKSETPDMDWVYKEMEKWAKTKNITILPSFLTIEFPANTLDSAYKQIRNEYNDINTSNLLSSFGIDGVIHTAKGGYRHTKNEKHFIPFNPNQIKSVFNKGEFSENKDNIFLAKENIDSNGEPTLKSAYPELHVEPDVLFAKESPIDNEESENPYVDDFFTDWFDEATTEQKEAYYNLQKSDYAVKLKDGSYIYKEGTAKERTLVRVSDFIKNKFPDDGFKSDNPEDYEINREWGNQFDDILEVLINTKGIKLDDIDKFKKAIELNLISRNADREQQFQILLSDNAITQAVKIFDALVSDLRSSGKILLSQKTLHTFDVEGKDIGGTTDIFVLHPDGSATIIDLKTSLDPFVGNYQKNGYTNSYDKPFTKTIDGKEKKVGASKKDRHRRQQSTYKGMAINLDIASDISTAILGLKLTSENGMITEVVNEGSYKYNLIPLHDIDNLVKLFGGKRAERLPEYEKFIANVRVSIQERIDAAKLAGTSSATIKELADLDTMMKASKSAEALGGYIDNLHSQVSGEDGYGNKFKKLEEELRDISLKSIDELSKIQSVMNTYKRFAESNLEVLKNLQEFYSGLDDIDAGSPLDHLNEVITALELIESRYKLAIIPLIAKRLEPFINTKVAQQMKDSINKEITKLEKQLAKFRTTFEKSRNRLHRFGIAKNIKNVKLSIDKLKKIPELSSKAIEDALRGINTADASLLERLFVTIMQTKDASVGTFVQMVKSKQIDMSKKLHDFAKDKISIFEKFAKESGRNKDNPEEFNKGIFEKILIWKNGLVEKYAFVQKQDVSQYQIDANEIFKQAETLKKQGNSKGARDVLVNFWKEAFVAKGDFLDIINSRMVNAKLNGTGDEFGIWITEEVGISKRDERLFNNNKITREKYITNVLNGLTSDFENYVRYNTKNELLELNDKKYHNPKWDALYNKDGSTKGFLGDYHKSLVEVYLKTQEDIPDAARKLGYIIPSVAASDIDLFKRDKKSYFKYVWDNIWKTTAKDAEDIGYNDNQKIIPIDYTWDMKLEETSLDLFSSIMRFKEGVERYKLGAEIEEDGYSMLAVLENRKTERRDSRGKTVFKKAAEKFGGKIADTVNADNTLIQLKHFVDAIVYRKESIPLEVAGIRVDKVLGSIRKYMSFTQIGGNIQLGFSNYANAEAQLRIDAFGGRHFGNKDLRKADAFWLKHSGSFIGDIGKPIRTSLLGQILEIYDPLQGEFLDKYGRKVTQSAAKRLWFADAWFAHMHIGELTAQSRTLLAILAREKVLLDGKEISLLDAYQVDEKTGKIKLQEGVESPLIRKDLMNKTHGINTKLHGLYHTFAEPVARKYAMGKMVEMYRKFVVPGVMRRYGSLQYDREIGELEEGYYRTFYKWLLRDRKNGLKFLFQNDAKLREQYSDLEIANMRKFFAETTTISAVALAIAIISSIYDDGDEEMNYYLRYPLYLLMRLSSELKFFWNPTDAYRIFRTPTAADSVIKKLVRVLGQFLDPFEEYKVKTGPAEKGDNKLYNYIKKLLGMNGLLTNPEQGIKSLRLYK